MRSHRRVRQADVARRANVSTAVVSKVLSGRASTSIRVGKEAERRVWEAVRELGYVPNLVAKSLARGERLLLGVFTFEPVFTARHRGFYVPFLLGVEREAEASGYDLVLFTSTSGDGRRRSVFRDGSNRLGIADGAILLGREADKRELQRLLRERYPFVFIGRREVPGGAVPYVAAGYTAATQAIMERLLALGHARFALIEAPGRSESKADRRAGYVNAYLGSGADRREVEASIVASETLTPAWLRDIAAAGVTAVLVENDTIGRSVLALADGIGLAIPDDLSLAVLGDPVDDPDDVPDWLTFAIPRHQMGREAVRLLQRVIAGAPPEVSQRTLPCEVVAGSTVAPPRMPG